ncbi:MAG: hypothetical protein GY853_04960 [PVC group bacterium]|nr:hypothetical protein [PVC group bacterium]
MKYSIKKLDDYYLVTTSGEMFGDGFLVMAKDLLSGDCWKPNGDVLFDHRDLDFSCVTTSDIEKIRAFHEEHEHEIGCGKSAILVKSGLLPDWKCLWEHGEKIKSDNIVEAFDDYEDAINWLNILP